MMTERTNRNLRLLKRKDNAKVYTDAHVNHSNLAEFQVAQCPAEIIPASYTINCMELVNIDTWLS